jgi:hypothetical protein
MADYNLKEDVFKWLETYGFKQNDPKMHWPSIKYFHNEVQEYMDAVTEGDETGMFLEMIDIQWQIHNMRYYGVPDEVIKIAGMFYMEGVIIPNTPEFLVYNASLKNRLAEQAVSQANWSKICHTEDEATHSVYLYKRGEHPQKMGHVIETTWEKVGDHYVVRTPEGKGMKSYLCRNPRDIYNELLKQHTDGSNI